MLLTILYSHLSVAKGFKDDKGKFHPTGNNDSGLSARQLIGSTKAGMDFSSKEATVLENGIRDEVANLLRLKKEGISKVEVDEIYPDSINAKIFFKGGILGGDVGNLNNAGFRDVSIIPKGSDIVFDTRIDRKRFTRFIRLKEIRND